MVVKSPTEVIADHLQEDDSAYASDREEAERAAQRIVDALLASGFVCSYFRGDVEAAINRGLQEAS